MTLKRRIAIGATAGALSIATAVVSQFEGYRPSAYRDPVGIPTICYGHTATARMGQTHSQARCEELLAGDLGHAFDTLERHTARPQPPKRKAALASFIYNVGEGAFARSTLRKKLNAGNVRGACNELTRWVYADGRKLRGLVKRRAAERKLCLAERDAAPGTAHKEGTP